MVSDSFNGSKYYGICIGGSTISAVGVVKNNSGKNITDIISFPHDGNPKQAFNDVIKKISIGQKPEIAVTGRRFKEFLDLPSLSEPQAVENALEYLNKGQKNPYKAVISIGGETFILYTVDEQGKISHVYTGNKCASGTGEFFLQQIGRLDLTIDQANQFGLAEKPHKVSGRCSVFCKSDCTHATNIGIPKSQVVAGLSKMMAEKVLELLKNIPKKNILLIGGVTRLSAMTSYLKEEIEGLVIPEYATCFEALGSALWAADNATGNDIDLENIYISGKSQFDFHMPLRDHLKNVKFNEFKRGIPIENDNCILGLDVGSTTTKAVIIRESDNKILCSEYLRTNGDPVGASVKCYIALLDQLKEVKINIRGLGVTGSGRKIAGLHALTDGIINEIIAHAEAALFFDPGVDTIFEIGGQDAKYTYLTNGVASDYAMNEACSAGTGSFLEEAAKESLGIAMEDIADWAMKGNRPPNFNDQCAAFISSDIKNTHHEGISKEDIIAGLVYSICLNYVNRVKGARPVGQKVFMQGGVCYNKAVPVAMAALTGKEIIVPPEPGLMGAFGVALEVKHRIERGLMKPDIFDLEQLIFRTVDYKENFTCKGGREKCDLGCSVNRVVIENKTYPFGGACNLYYNLRNKIKVNSSEHDYVALRSDMVFHQFAPRTEMLPENAKKVGISKSLLMNTFYPLFSHFLMGLGYKPVLVDEMDEKGIDRCTAAFCYPCEMSHGYFSGLLKNKDLDYILIPHIIGIDSGEPGVTSKTCPLVQGESYYLKAAFEKELVGGPEILTPVFDFSKPVQSHVARFIEFGKMLGCDDETSLKAYNTATVIQDSMKKEFIRLGQDALKKIESDSSNTGIILFGRPYNAFTPDGNKGIPHKFASRGHTILPVDFLDLSKYFGKQHMYWAMGQINLKGAHYIKNHSQLYGTFITNFSCGPDSFVVGYFRDILGTKPSLTLELDNHTADAGLETRVEAFLDIIQRYRKLSSYDHNVADDTYRRASSALNSGHYEIATSEGDVIDLYDPRVKLVFSSIGNFSAEAAAATYQSVGIRAIALPEMTEEELKIGRGNTSCKECLPLQLTTGSLLKYLKGQREPDEVTVYFMPMADGPCRFGQYNDFINDLLQKQKIENVTLFSMSSNDGYGGLGTRMILQLWKSIVIADIFEDVYNAVNTLAVDKPVGLEEVNKCWKIILNGISEGGKAFDLAIEECIPMLKNIKSTIPLEKAPQVLIVGEIYVRKDNISRRWIPERLAENGLVPHVAPMHEWGHYVDWLYTKKMLDADYSMKNMLAHRLKTAIKAKAEKKIKTKMAKSGWYIPRMIDIEHVIHAGENFIDRQLTGEAILTVGGPVAEVGDGFCGSVAIGPFGCMPNRLSESILNVVMDREHILPIRKSEALDKITSKNPFLPFLAIESDGNPFPQVIEARLETFIMQAHRMHDIIKTS